MKRTVLLGLLIVSLTGCGGSGEAGKVAVIARSESQAEGATCDKVRDDAVSGQLVGLYSCTLTGVPPQYRPAGSFDNPTLHYCFGFANNTGVNMTQRFGLTCKQSEGVQSEAVVHVYFCTADTCAREATQAQINAVSLRASESSLVGKVIFVSKEEALAILRRKHPEEVKLLPSNPLPDTLTVIPNHPEDVEQVAALFSADPAPGIDKVDYSR